MLSTRIIQICAHPNSSIGNNCPIYAQYIVKSTLNEYLWFLVNFCAKYCLIKFCPEFYQIFDRILLKKIFVNHSYMGSNFSEIFDAISQKD